MAITKKRVQASASVLLSLKHLAMIVLLFCLGTFSYMILSSFMQKEKNSIQSLPELSVSANESSSCGSNSIILQPSSPQVVVVSQPNIPYNNLQNTGAKDVLLNPYTPPLSDERYLVPMASAVPYGAVAVNVSSNRGVVDTAYRQVGMVTPVGGGGGINAILPLMGRPLYSRRDKWQYYTISNQHNNIKLPILVKGKSALIEYGVDTVYDGDVVYIEGVDSAYKVRMYDSDTIRYLPSL